VTRTVGRDRELTRARERLTAETPGCVVFVGPAGIGKSTVLAATARLGVDLGWRVLGSRATASERDLPYVGVHDLVGGSIHEVTDALPNPLRRALDVVLLRADPPVGGADVLAVNVAVLEVLNALAERDRLLLVLDDLQWLDAPTRRVLEFAVRRLAPERVAVVAASRESSPETLPLVPEPIELIAVGSLSEHDVADLVALRTGRVTSPRQAAELHRLSDGNPFLALELARDLGAPSRAAQFSVPERYAALLEDRLSRLSSGGRKAVLAAALLSRPTSAVLERTAGPGGLAEAEAAGVLHSGGAPFGSAVEFDHPLLAAACREAAGPVAVREMHLELASLADDPVEQAHHRALGTTAVDAALADELEAAAGLAAQRAAIATAAGLARDALRLTPGSELADRVRRAVRACGWFVQCGELAEARAVVTPLLEALPAGPLRARCLVARADALGQAIGDVLALLEEAIHQPGIEAATEVEARMGVVGCLINTGKLERARLAARGTAAVAARTGMTEVLRQVLLMEAEIDLFLGVPLADSQAWARARGQANPPGARTYEHPDRTESFAVAWRDEPAAAARLVDGLLQMARERGDLASEGGLMMHRAEFALRCGDLVRARECAERCYRLGADGVRDQLPLYIRAHVEAWQGDLDEARRLAGTGLKMADEVEDAIFAAQCLLVLGFTEVSAGRFGDAVPHETRLRDLMGQMRWGHPGALRWQGDAVEAFLATGQEDAADEVTTRLWKEADQLDLPGCRAIAARCEGLAHAHRGDLKLAEDSLLESLALMTEVQMPLERGRTLLALGAARRRNRQKATANAALLEARGIFAVAGAPAWVARVDDEVERTSGARAGQSLTVGERTVAELAAAGKTNREIGARLYLSPKTVETVLTRVYRKVGVRSRTELAQRLEGVRKGFP
jgi:DNA-binding CsgD family transcriptional regulator